MGGPRIVNIADPWHRRSRNERITVEFKDPARHLGSTVAGLRIERHAPDKQASPLHRHHLQDELFLILCQQRRDARVLRCASPRVEQPAVDLLALLPAGVEHLRQWRLRARAQIRSHPQLQRVHEREVAAVGQRVVADRALACCVMAIARRRSNPATSSSIGRVSRRLTPS